MAHRFQRSIQTWRAPPNWSLRDWFEELKAEGIAATWEARARLRPGTRSSPGRVRPAAGLDPYSQSLPAGMGLRRRHCGSRLEGSNDGDVAIDEGFSSIEDSESLQTCLRRLPDPQLRLIEGIFWEEKTEVEVAGILCLTQSGISRRKQRILEQLRRWLGRTDKEKTDCAKD